MPILREIRRIETIAVMSVFENRGGTFGHYKNGSINPAHARMASDTGTNFSPLPEHMIIDELLAKFQEAGVVPGRKIRVIIEEVVNEEGLESE